MHLMRRDIGYIRPDVLAGYGNDIPLPLYVACKERIGLYMLPTFSDEERLEVTAPNMLFGWNKKLMKRLLH